MKGTVVVGLSGGVDSSVAAALLLREGYRVIGATMKIWDGREVAGGGALHACYGPGEEEDIEDAEEVCRVLDIPFHVIDLVEEYNQKILEPCSSQYLSGLTPNPCVHCNYKLKFGEIPAALRRLGVEFDYFATGHYARSSFDSARGRYLLRRGVDAAKDQSYFLFLLDQAQLAEILFPLGCYTKSEIRKIASELSLPSAQRAESQDFISGGYRSLFGDLDNPGRIVTKQGDELGRHGGVHLYTIGQRRGIGVAGDKPLYVVDLDAKKNEVVVGGVEELSACELTAGSMNWISVPGPENNMPVQAKIRYRHTPADAVLQPLESADRVKVVFQQPQRAVAPGQAVVLYDGDIVLGGGIIERRVVDTSPQ